jgi:hypothetical protein
MTIQYLKEFGKYIGFSESKKAYIYAIDTRLFKIDRNGASKY